MNNQASKLKILVVDDEAINFHVLSDLLKEEFEVSVAKSGKKALELYLQKKHDLVLLDINMPDMNGFEVAESMHRENKELPILFLSAETSVESIAKGFKLGAVDYITKPIDAKSFLLKLGLWAKLIRKTQESEKQQQLLSEYKNTVDRSSIVSKTDKYGRITYVNERFCEISGYSKEELLGQASPMHDIGKVGIADSILNKPGKLTAEEFEIMKVHSELGYEMLKHSERPILKTAATIAYTHHEKYDGSGYPKGVKGEDIPIEGRITAVADVFDALGHDRCYKKAWEIDRILELFSNTKEFE